MARYDVQAHDGDGVLRDVAMALEAPSPSEAVLLARRGAPGHPGADYWVVSRRRRLRGRKVVGTFAGGRGDDGLAGVREPRRPRPTPPGLRAHADPPAYRDI